MALNAHLMAKSYGQLPTDILDQPMSMFWRNALIHQAGTQYEAEQKRQAQEGGQQARRSTEAEKAQSVRRVEERADARDAAAGQSASIEDQMAALNGGDT